MPKFYYCTRQRAGPLIKESRAKRPRLSPTDAAWERRDKNKIIKSSKQSAVCRTAVDRLEIRLALMGYHSSFYTLTFDDDNLPDSFQGVRAALRAFLVRARRFRDDQPFDYIYAIEGLHSRFHIHLILKDSDFNAQNLAKLWQSGFIHAEPVLQSDGGFRRIAEYLNKERADGDTIPLGRHPWSCSRSLSNQLPPVEKFKSNSGRIRTPRKALYKTFAHIENSFGEYHYASYILPEK